MYSKDRAVCHDFSSLVRKTADLFVFYIMVNSRISLREGGRESRKRGRKKEERERERWRKKEREVKEEGCRMEKALERGRVRIREIRR